MWISRSLLRAAGSGSGGSFSLVRRGASKLTTATGAGVQQQQRFLSVVGHTATWTAGSVVVPDHLGSNDQTKRSLSYYQPSHDGGNSGYGGGTSGGGGTGTGGPPLRAFPTYAVFGEECLLSVKLLPPKFRIQPHTNIMYLDSSKKGRILLEWTPRDATGKLSRDRDAQLRFGLSAEEVGLMLDQLPSNIVEFSRQPAPEHGGAVPDKVLRITPGDGDGSVSFLIDFELNGVGGQSPSLMSSSPVSDGVTATSPSPTTTGPLEVVAQLGEFQVIRELMRSSIPLLAGWSTMMEIAMQRSLENSMQYSTSSENHRGGGGGYGGSGGYGGTSEF